MYNKSEQNVKKNYTEISSCIVIQIFIAIVANSAIIPEY